jgi:hypothetical protein
MNNIRRIELVKEWLAKEDRSAAWLSRRCGYSDAYLRLVVKGHLPFTYELIQAIEQETGLTLSNSH